MLLFYIRHGEPIYDPDSLTPLGHEQAEAVCKRLARYGVDRIFASTSNRAIQTAEPLSKALNKEICLLDFCNEGYAWADFSLVSKDKKHSWAFHIPEIMELFAERSMSLNKDWYNDPRLPKNNFERGMARIDKEVDAWLLSLGYEHDRERGVYKTLDPTNERVALFAHQGFGLAFLSSLLDIPYPIFCAHFDIGLSNMTVIEFDDNNGVAIPRVLTYSNDGHLYAEDMSTEYNYKNIF